MSSGILILKTLLTSEFLFTGRLQVFIFFLHHLEWRFFDLIWLYPVVSLPCSNAMMSFLTTLHQRFTKEHSKSLKKELVYTSTYLLFKLVHQYNTILKKNDQFCLLQNKFGGRFLWMLMKMTQILFSNKIAMIFWFQRTLVAQRRLREC